MGRLGKRYALALSTVWRSITVIVIGAALFFAGIMRSNILVTVHRSWLAEEVIMDIDFAETNSGSAHKSDGSSFLYSVVFDAGSTGTRVHIFRFILATKELLSESFESSRPGLSTCNQDDQSEQIAVCIHALLTPLLDFARSSVPVELQPTTSLSLQATAGLRLLPSAKAAELLLGIERFLRKSSFVVSSVQVMPGEDEGAFLWLAVRHLQNTFRQAIVLDLGGASTQIAYSIAPRDLPDMSSNDDAKFIRGLKLTEQDNTALYARSILGFGLLAARHKMMNQANLTGMAFLNPCMWEASNAEFHYEGQLFKGHGSGNPPNCALLYRQILRNSSLPCLKDDGCKFNRFWGGPVIAFGKTQDREVIACSMFYYVLEDAGFVQDNSTEIQVSPKVYMHLAEEVCSRPITTWSSSERKAWLCSDLVYVATLLTDGFGFAATQPLLAVKEIVSARGQSFKATWPLGVALSQLRNITST